MKKFFSSDVTRIAISLILLILAVILEQYANTYVALTVYLLTLALCGYRVFADAIRGIIRRDLLDEKFLMSIASIGAMIVGEWSEGVAVMLFYLVGESFEKYAVRKSRSSIRSLMDICPDEACVLSGGVESVVDAEDVEPSSIIVIRSGERVPIDCQVVFGSADVDTSSMTGESLPVSATVGSTLSSGYIIKSGLVHAKTLRAASESAAARVLALVENASDSKSREENFITKFSRVYTPAVVIIALLVAILPALFGFMSLERSVYTALTFLVISCPCALVISVPMAFFGGIGGAASRGILFKGGNVFSKVASVETVAFDKTGTLTNGVFSVQDVICYGMSREEILSLAASTEYASNHPIAECLKSSADRITTPSLVDEQPGYGIVATFSDYKVAVGNLMLMEKIGVDITKIDKPSGGAVYVAKNNTLAGVIIISDCVKPEAAQAIKELKSFGVKHTVILSGDREENVLNVAARVGVDEAKASMTPEQKYSRLEELIKSSRSTMYVGDGINDSPSLARADVGVAMGSVGQDSAIEASDVVIMTDNLLKLSEAVRISRKTINISWQNIVFALGTKGLILIFGLLGFANMCPALARNSNG